MEVYHENVSASVACSPYAVTFVPPVGKLLDIICEDLSVGGCFRPGNRKLADRMGYASASQIPYLLSQLACDGWINYDPDTRWIWLLRDPRADQPIRSIDQIEAESALENEPLGAIDPIDRRSVQQIETSLIDPIDRDVADQGAEYGSDRIDRSNPQRMEDSCLTTTESFSESAVVNKTQIPCAAKTINPADHPIALLLAELLPPPGRGVLEKVLAVAPPWTPQQIRDRYEYDKPRIEQSGGQKTWGIFWNCLKAGERAPTRADPNRPLDVAAYADVPGFRLGSDTSDPADDLRNRADRLLPPVTPATIRFAGADLAFVMRLLGSGASDQQTAQALAERTRRRFGGAP